ncbi:MAG: hypothetical protein K5886_12035 [Lachnospiraceae bacterium]|nr:hypothetical protein [Lachnospiraceae bacterium]
MKKLTTCMVMILCFLLLSGASSCHGPQYEEADVQEMEDKGKELMQDWLDAHIEGAKVTSAYVYINYIPSGPQYLTDSVFGEFTVGDEKRIYEIETDENEVYLTTDANILNDFLGSYILEFLGLSDRADECTLSDVDNSFLSQSGYGNEEIYKDYGSAYFMPGETVLALEQAGFEITEDDSGKSAKKDFFEEGSQSRVVLSDEAVSILDEFIRDPGNRPMINVGGNLSIPDDIDLKPYDMAYFTELKKEKGINFRSFYIYQDNVTVSALGWYTVYERMERKPCEDFYVEYTAEYISDECRDGEIKQKEYYTNSVDELMVKETGEGYSFSFRDPEKWFNIHIYADDDSKIRKHDYILRHDQGAHPGKYGGGRYIDRNVDWSRTDDGMWVLVTDDGVRAWFSDADTLVFSD